MPAALERALKKQAMKRVKGKGAKKRRRAYRFGTLREIERKHRAKGGRPGKYMSGKI